MKKVAIRVDDPDAFHVVRFQDLLSKLESQLKERFPGCDAHITRCQSNPARSAKDICIYVPSQNNPALRERVSVTLGDSVIAGMVYRGEFEKIAKMLENRISMHEKRGYI